MRVIVGEMVAEKSAVWRSAGVAARIVSRSSAKPMSSISSASSRTTMRDLVEAQAAALEVVDRAAGRGDDDVDAASQPAELLADRLAAVDRQDPRAELAAVAHGAPPRPASRARGSGPGSSADVPSLAGRARCAIRWSMGRAKAAVLPVPVGASASRSRPASRGGIASRWIGVGSS